jgi:hypothetical protein
MGQWPGSRRLLALTERASAGRIAFLKSAKLGEENAYEDRHCPRPGMTYKAGDIESDLIQSGEITTQ